MRHPSIPALLAMMMIAGCDATTGRSAVVRNAGPEELLKLRAGPGLGYKVILGLPDGTSLTRRTCVTELGQLWCQVSLTDEKRIMGYVSADYLSAP